MIILLPSEVAANGSIEVNRKWEVLPRVAPRNPVAARASLRTAARKLGKDSFELAGVEVDQDLLLDAARAAESEPLTRALRERMSQAVDVRDFLFFLDDLIPALRQRDLDVALSSGRARSAGVLLHPDDIYEGRPRLYGRRSRRLRVESRELRPVDEVPRWTLLGSIWTAAFRQPESREAHFEALEEARPESDFRERIEDLITQLEDQGAEVSVYASVRKRERGYLIYGSYILSRANSALVLERRLSLLRRMRRRRGLEVPIRWSHPGGWRKTVQAARKMADAFGVVYATRQGALRSNHYDGKAIDFAATGLPKRLNLVSFDRSYGYSFDLSRARESRDLSLTPRLVAWVARAFGLEKLESDYAHWNDAS